MLIKFNQHDLLMPSIRIASKLFNYDAKHQYHIYGLSMYRGNWPIKLYATRTLLDAVPKNLFKFLKTQGVEMAIESHTDMSDRTIYIGLRYDVRQNLSLSCAILQTIIYANDGLIKISNKTKALVNIKPFPLDPTPNVLHTS